MRAVVWTAYGPPDVLRLREVEKPVPKDDEVLIRVRAAAVTAGDCEMRSLKMPLLIRLPMRAFVGLRRPKRVTVLGQDLAGEVEAVGRDVTRFREGDQVFGSAGIRAGAYAECLCVPEDSSEGALALKPANMTYEEAAAVPLGGREALHFLRKADIRSGDEVLISGAGGSIGTAGVQLAKHWGAEVTAVDSAGKLDMLRSLGADHVIDYAEEDFTRGGRAYDVIFDVIGTSPFSRCVGSLKENGCYLIANPTPSRMIRARRVSSRTSKDVVVEMSSPTTESLDFLRELIEAGDFESVIDRRYPLEETAEAHRYVETGQKKGNVVITV